MVQSAVRLSNSTRNDLPSALDVADNDCQVASCQLGSLDGPKNIAVVVQLLIDNGIDPNDLQVFGRSFFDNAIASRHLDDDNKYQVLKLLLVSPLIEIDVHLIRRLVGHPDAIYQVLKNADKGLRLMIRNDFNDLHSVII